MKEIIKAMDGSNRKFKKVYNKYNNCSGCYFYDETLHCSTIMGRILGKLYSCDHAHYILVTNNIDLWKKIL